MVEASESLGEVQRLPPERDARRRTFDDVPDDAVIDLSKLSRVWIRWSWLPLLAAIGSLYFGYQDLKAFNPQRIATMIILPVAGGPQQGVATGVGALAAQFGIQIAQPTTAPFDRMRLTLSSIELAQRLQDRFQIMQRIYGGSWDPVSQTWVRPTGPDFERQERLRAFLRQNLWIPPDLEALAKYIGSSIKIESTGTGAFMRMSVTHTDGEFALWLLGTAFNTADELLREEEKKQSLQRRAYIERELSRQTMLNIQDALRSLLGAELNRDISLEGNTSYAASVAQAPYLSSAVTEPNLVAMFGAPAVGAFALAFLLITFVAVIRMERI